MSQTTPEDGGIIFKADNDVKSNKIVGRNEVLKLAVRRVITFVMYLAWFFVKRPLKCVYHMLVKGEVVEDTERNKQLFEFCTKIIMDPGYEASTPLERWTEMERDSQYKQMCDLYADEDGLVLTPDTQVQFRFFMARKTAFDMMEHFVGKAA